jgi:hypothetical protein
MDLLMSPVFTYNKTLRLLKKFKQYDLEKLTTHHIPLNSMDDIFDIVNEDKFIKVHIDPILN